MPIIGRFGSLAGLGSLILPGGAMESIATVTVGSGGASSIEFTSIPGTYQHLQVRGLTKDTVGAASYSCLTQFNGDTTAANYATHILQGNGTTASSAGYTSTGGAYTPVNPGSSLTYFGAFVIDILDYSNTSKNTTIRSMDGHDQNGSGAVRLVSGLWISTAAVTSIKLVAGNTAFAQHSTAALFGLRAP
jgi:hypothetical protein